jgi:hypothetical protein
MKSNHEIKKDQETIYLENQKTYIYPQFREQQQHLIAHANKNNTTM